MAAILGNRGARVISADLVARKIMRRPEVISNVAGAIGVEPTASGELDRTEVAAIVFRDSSARAHLNAIVHPLVQRDVFDRLVALSDEGYTGDVVVEIPLLVDGAHEHRYPLDLVITVECAQDVAIERMMSSRGWSREECLDRLKSQASPALRREIADVVIDTSLSPSIDELATDVLSRIETFCR